MHSMWEKTTEEWIPNVRRVSGKEQTVCKPAQPKHRESTGEFAGWRELMQAVRKSSADKRV